VPGVNVSLPVFYHTDLPRLISFASFEYVEKSKLLILYFIYIEHEFFLPSVMEAHNFYLVPFQNPKFLILRSITMERIVYALIQTIFHRPVICVAFGLGPVYELPEAFFNTKFLP
jgi:hypothetical protein